MFNFSIDFLVNLYLNNIHLMNNSSKKEVSICREYSNRIIEQVLRNHNYNFDKNFNISPTTPPISQSTSPKTPQQTTTTSTLTFLIEQDKKFKHSDIPTINRDINNQDSNQLDINNNDNNNHNDNNVNHNKTSLLSPNTINKIQDLLKQVNTLTSTLIPTDRSMLQTPQQTSLSTPITPLAMTLINIVITTNTTHNTSHHIFTTHHTFTTHSTLTSQTNFIKITKILVSIIQ
ncbi:hypothetical protein ACTA71_009655 [Dictyostelium dimigraforme]